MVYYIYVLPSLVNDDVLACLLSLVVYVNYLIFSFIFVSSRKYGLTSLIDGRQNVLVPTSFLRFPAYDCYFPMLCCQINPASYLAPSMIASVFIYLLYFLLTEEHKHMVNY